MAINRPINIFCELTPNQKVCFILGFILIGTERSRNGQQNGFLNYNKVYFLAKQ